jgi:hypothetical protein
LKSQDTGQIAVAMKLAGYADKNTKEITVNTDKGFKTLKVVAIIVPAKKSQ